MPSVQVPKGPGFWGEGGPDRQTNRQTDRHINTLVPGRVKILNLYKTHFSGTLNKK